MSRLKHPLDLWRLARNPESMDQAEASEAPVIYEKLPL